MHYLFSLISYLSHKLYFMFHTPVLHPRLRPLRALATTSTLLAQMHLSFLEVLASKATRPLLVATLPSKDPPHMLSSLT